MVRQTSRRAQPREKGAQLTPVSTHEFSKCRQQVHELVSRRAYELFEARGRAHGRDWEDWYRAEAESLCPVHVELSDAGSALLAVAAVNGYPMESLKVSAEPRRLWICGLPPAPGSKKDGSKERLSRIVPFLRSFSLSAYINPSAVSTEIRNDVLEVRMPKILP